MRGSDAIRGDLQQEIMRVLWRIDRATVEEVRNRLPADRTGAYTTVQTVLNRLSERGLVDRHADGRVIVYSAAFSEAEYLSRSILNALNEASDEARHIALAGLADHLEESDLETLWLIAEQVRSRRQ